MKTSWLARRGAPRLLVFCNGWGMDEGVVAELAAPPATDLLEVHDYAGLDAGAFGRALAPYRSYRLVAWSLGVWASAVLVAATGRAPEGAIAINGTCRPIDEACGIPPRLFRDTVERCSAASRDSFERRMCGGAAALAHFRARAPQRDVTDQAAELRALEKGIAAAPAPASIFSQAIVGLRDGIMPPESQRRSWGAETAVRSLPLPHYPFFDLTSWDEILGGAGDR